MTIQRKILFFIFLALSLPPLGYANPRSSCDLGEVARFVDEIASGKALQYLTSDAGEAVAFNALNAKSLFQKQKVEEFLAHHQTLVADDLSRKNEILDKWLENLMDRMNSSSFGNYPPIEEIIAYKIAQYPSTKKQVDFFFESGGTFGKSWVSFFKRVLRFKKPLVQDKSQFSRTNRFWRAFKTKITVPERRIWQKEEFRAYLIELTSHMVQSNHSKFWRHWFKKPQSWTVWKDFAERFQNEVFRVQKEAMDEFLRDVAVAEAVKAHNQELLKQVRREVLEEFYSKDPIGTVSRRLALFKFNPTSVKGRKVHDDALGLSADDVFEKQMNTPAVQKLSPEKRLKKALKLSKPYQNEVLYHDEVNKLAAEVAFFLKPAVVLSVMMATVWLTYLDVNEDIEARQKNARENHEKRVEMAQKEWSFVKRWMPEKIAQVQQDIKTMRFIENQLFQLMELKGYEKQEHSFSTVEEEILNLKKILEQQTHPNAFPCKEYLQRQNDQKPVEKFCIDAVKRTLRGDHSPVTVQISNLCEQRGKIVDPEGESWFYGNMCYISHRLIDTYDLLEIPYPPELKTP